MKKLLLCLFLVVSITATSQKVYFIYLQSEQEQPFFVKLDEKIYSSSASGYLILSKLRDSTYNFSIGFPQQKWPEQKFTITIRSKDQGYLLKNFGEKGWGLFNLQTLAVLMPVVESKPGSMRTEKKDVTPFTDILARAADDPSLRERTVHVAKTEEKKDVPVVAVVREEVKPVDETPKDEPQKVTHSETAAKKTEIKEQPATKTIESKAAPKDTQLAKKDTPPEKKEPVAENPNTAVGVTEVATVKIGEIKNPANETAKKETNTPSKDPVQDTVLKPVDSSDPSAVKIGEMKTGSPETVKKDEPVAVPPMNTNEVAKTADTKPEAKNDTAEKKDPAKSNDAKASVITKTTTTSTSEGLGITFIDEHADGIKDTISIIIPDPKPTIVAKTETPKDEKKFLDISTEPAEVVVVIPVTTEKPATKPVAKNNCRAIADGDDFLKLRKKMVAEMDDDDMVDEARKYFKTKCFTTLQVKNLGVLFLDDLGKYKFFDMAYVFVADLENFPTLQSELTNDYYINRFKAMIRGN